MIEHLPFLACAVSGQTPKMNAPRVVEALVIAAITAITTSTLTADKVTARLEERVAAITSRIEKCERVIESHDGIATNIRERLARCEMRYGK